MRDAHKTGARMKGVKVSTKKFSHVEEVDCEGGGKHVLSNTPSGQTRCEKCHHTWAALDLAVNGAR